MFVDFAIAYALLNFWRAVVVSRYLNRTDSLREMEEREKAKGAKAYDRIHGSFASGLLKRWLHRGDAWVAFQILGMCWVFWAWFSFWVHAVGMVRFPDFYTRMHASGKGIRYPPCSCLSGFGLLTMEDYSIVSWLVFVKIMAIVLFIYITSPTSTHVLMKAAFEDNICLWMKKT